MATNNYKLDGEIIPKEIFERLNPLVKAYLIWEKENSENNRIKEASE